MPQQCGKINMNIVNPIITAISDAGIPCCDEYGADRFEKKRGEVHAYAGIKKIKLERLRCGVSDVTAHVRVTVQAFGSEGEAVRTAAEKTVIPAVMDGGAEVYSAEISETFYEAKCDRVYCEIIFEVRRHGYDICS